MAKQMGKLALATRLDEETVGHVQYEHQQESTLGNSLNFIQSLFTSTEGDSKNGKSTVVLSKKFSASSDKPWDFFAQEIFKLELDDLKKNRIHTIKWKGSSRPVPKLDLIIDFNELQNFSLEWKESLFNDAIYVMLKNACEHSIETYTNKDNHREIFLDVYISETADCESLNVEFTNSTGKICKEVFEHINNGITIKNNTRKENSTGIGVVTIRKRLDVTYGKEKANIKFTVISEDKIKSLLYFPIKSLHNDLVFLDPNDCNNESKVLYLEDTPEYYKQNIDLLKSKAIGCTHEVRFKTDYKYDAYNLMITDLNIFGPQNDHASSSNGIDAIKYFTGKNKNGVVIVLSTDVDEISNKNFGQYIIVTEENLTNEFSTNHIYLFKKKYLNEDILGLISQYLGQNQFKDAASSEKSSLQQTNIKSSIKKQKAIKKFNNILDFDSISNIKDILTIDDVHGKLFIAQKEIEDILKWLDKEIQYDDILTYEITNCEKPDIFITKLIVFSDNMDFILKHELLRRNIVFLPKKIKNNETKVLEFTYNTMKYEIPKNGIFGKISHDVLNKMPEFSIYTKSKIEELKKLNDKVRSSFGDYFDGYLKSTINDNTFKDIEYDFNILKEELTKLKNEAVSKKIHLGTDRETLVVILDKLDFIRS